MVSARPASSAPERGYGADSAAAARCAADSAPRPPPFSAARSASLAKSCASSAAAACAYSGPELPNIETSSRRAAVCVEWSAARSARGSSSPPPPRAGSRPNSAPKRPARRCAAPPAPGGASKVESTSRPRSPVSRRLSAWRRWRMPATCAAQSPGRRGTQHSHAAQCAACAVERGEGSLCGESGGGAPEGPAPAAPPRPAAPAPRAGEQTPRPPPPRAGPPRLRAPPPRAAEPVGAAPASTSATYPRSIARRRAVGRSKKWRGERRRRSRGIAGSLRGAHTPRSRGHSARPQRRDAMPRAG